MMNEKQAGIEFAFVFSISADRLRFISITYCENRGTPHSSFPPRILRWLDLLHTRLIGTALLEISSVKIYLTTALLHPVVPK
ncbi:MAG: hypothetical protein H6Q65_2187 [Firmicutes bacterium]|nr:hypothetical protein [Bacillota bacterium]